MITERPFHSSARAGFLIGASLVIVILQAAGVDTRTALQYSRPELMAGDWYRLVSAHWVHLDWTHALMNLAGLWLVGLLDSELRIISGCIRCLVLGLAISAGFYMLHPDLLWYVGFSGVLHGLLAIVLIRAAWLRRQAMVLILLALLIGKLLWEHYHGALTQSAFDAPVIVAAHSYGAIAGALYAAASGASQRYLARRTAQVPRNDT